MGVGMGLKKKNPAIKIIEAHPVQGHYIQGLKNMQEPLFLKYMTRRKLIKGNG